MMAELQWELPLKGFKKFVKEYGEYSQCQLFKKLERSIRRYSNPKTGTAREDTRSTRS